MRHLLLTSLLSALTVTTLSPADAQEPSQGGAWSACQGWVKQRLYEPEGLRFPTLGTDQVQVERVRIRVGHDRYVVRSYGVIPEEGGREEVLPFTCEVDFGDSRRNPRGGYGFYRLTLPDSTVALPPAPGTVQGGLPAPVAGLAGR